jgi:hypothetical protein
VYAGIWGSSVNNLWIFGGIVESTSTMSLLVLEYVGGAWKDATPSPGPSAIYAMGGTLKDTWAVGFEGAILHYTGNWTVFASPTKNHLNDVWGSATDDIWAVGDNGTILHFNGSAWVPVPSPTTKKIRGVWGSSSTHVWAVGESGTILQLQ